MEFVIKIPHLYRVNRDRRLSCQSPYLFISLDNTSNLRRRIIRKYMSVLHVWWYHWQVKNLQLHNNVLILSKHFRLIRWKLETCYHKNTMKTYEQWIYGPKCYKFSFIPKTYTKIISTHNNYTTYISLTKVIHLKSIYKYIYNIEGVF